MFALQAAGYRYGPCAVLEGLSATIEGPGLVAVIGPNGAGKSTVFKAIFGLLTLRSGTIRFEGRDITGWTPRQLLERRHEPGFARAEQDKLDRSRQHLFELP